MCDICFADKILIYELLLLWLTFCIDSDIENTPNQTWRTRFYFHSFLWPINVFQFRKDGVMLSACVPLCLCDQTWNSCTVLLWILSSKGNGIILVEKNTIFFLWSEWVLKIDQFDASETPQAKVILLIPFILWLAQTLILEILNFFYQNCSIICGAVS